MSLAGPSRLFGLRACARGALRPPPLYIRSFSSTPRRIAQYSPYPSHPASPAYPSTPAAQEPLLHRLRSGGGLYRHLQERADEDMRREEEREREQSTWNKYGRREPLISWWRPIVFTLGFSGGAYGFASWWTNRDTSAWAAKLNGPMWRLSSGAITRAKQHEEKRRAEATLGALPGVLDFLPTFLLVPILRSYIMFEEARINARPANRVQAEIIGGLAVVFLGWRMRSTAAFMVRWFLHNPIAWTRRQDWRNSFTMLSSTFSHKEVAHLAFNCIGLYGFGSAAYMYLATHDSPTQPALLTSTHVPHYLAFFAVAGLVSSLGAHLVNNLVRLPRLLRALRSPARLSPTNALAAHHAIRPSLGASGAIYACLTMTALAYPDASVSLIFLPMFAFPIPAAVAGMVMVDVVGIWRGWRAFDHIAHLCGAIFGGIYYYVGKDVWYWFRKLTLDSETPPRKGITFL